MGRERYCGACRAIIEPDGRCPFCAVWCCPFCDDAMGNDLSSGDSWYCRRCDRYFLLRLVYTCCGETRVVGWGHEC
jgi:hypothetical protein